jgi:hypothetical protein
MWRVKSSEVDQGGFTIKTSRTEDGKFQASVLGRPEIKPIVNANERIAIESMTTELDKLSQSGELDG